MSTTTTALTSTCEQVMTTATHKSEVDPLIGGYREPEINPQLPLPIENHQNRPDDINPEHVIQQRNPEWWETLIFPEVNSNLEMIQADSITGEPANTENIGGNVSWMDPKSTAMGNAGIGYDDQSNDQLVTEFISDSKTFSPIEFDVAVPLLTDQPVTGDQLEALGSDVCQQLGGLIPKSDLPFGCN